MSCSESTSTVFPASLQLIVLPKEKRVGKVGIENVKLQTPSAMEKVFGEGTDM